MNVKTKKTSAAKSLLAVLLCLIMIAGLLPVSALAEGTSIAITPTMDVADTCDVVEGKLPYDANESEFSVAYTAKLPMTQIWAYYTQLKSINETIANGVTVSGNFEVTINLDDSLTVNSDKLTQVNAQKAFEDATNNPDLMNLFVIGTPSVSGQVITIPVSIASGVTGAKLGTLQAAGKLGDLFVTTPEGVVTMTQKNYLSAQEDAGDESAEVTSTGGMTGTIKLTSPVPAFQNVINTAVGNTRGEIGVTTITADVNSPTFYLDPKGEDKLLLLDIVPANKENLFGKDYNTGYTVDNELSYTGTEGSTIKVPYSSALDVSSVFTAYDKLTNAGVIGDNTALSGSLSFSFDYDMTYLAGPVENTVALVQAAFDKSNAESSLALLYEVTNVQITTTPATETTPKTGHMQVTMELQDGVTGKDIKAAKAVSSTLYVEGSFNTQTLTTEMDGKDVWVTSGKMENTVNIGTNFVVTRSFESTTNDADADENKNPGYAADKFVLNVDPKSTVTVNVPVDMMPNQTGNMQVIDTAPDWYSGHTKENVNSGVFSGLTGNVGYTAWLNLDSVIEKYKALTNNSTVGDQVPLSGSMTNTFTFDTAKLTENAAYSDKAVLIEALYDANAANGLNEDAVPGTDVKLVNLFKITDASIVGDKVTVVLTLKSGVTGATMKKLTDQTITLKTPDDMFTASVSEGDVVWANNGSLNGKITLGAQGASALLPLTISFISGTNDATGKLDTQIPAAEKFVVSVKNAAMEIEKSADPKSGSTVNRGSEITYTLTYKNTGSADAKNVVITDALPKNTTFVSASDGGTLNNGVVTWNVGTVEPVKTGDAAKTVTFKVKVDNSAPAGAKITNTASVKADMLSTVNSNTVEHNIQAGNPKTWDDLNAALWLTITLLAAGGLTAVFLGRRKRALSGENKNGTR